MDESDQREITKQHEESYQEALAKMRQADRDTLEYTESLYTRPITTGITTEMIQNLSDGFMLMESMPEGKGKDLLKQNLLDKSALMTELHDMAAELQAARRKVWASVQAMVYQTLTKAKFEPKWMCDGNLSGRQVQVKFGMD
jgi:hypothetical protein